MAIAATRYKARSAAGDEAQQETSLKRSDLLSKEQFFDSELGHDAGRLQVEPLR